jgi:hypothetical protein
VAEFTRPATWEDVKQKNFELMLRNVTGLDVDARCAAIGSTTETPHSL